MKNINYIKDNYIYFSDNTRKYVAIINEYIINLFQVSENIYINIENVEEINFVDNYIVFNNKYILNKIIKKICV